MRRTATGTPQTAAPLPFRGLLLALRPVHRMAVRAEQQHGGTLVALVGQRDEQVRAVGQEHPRRVEGAQPLILPDHRGAEPGLECGRPRVAGQLPQEVRVAGRLPRVVVLPVEPHHLGPPAARGHLLVPHAARVERVEEPPAMDDVRVRPKAVLPVEPQRHLARQVEPRRHLLLLPRRRVGRRQALQHPTLAQEHPEELRLLHTAHRLEAVELPAAQCRRHELLVLLEGFPAPHSCLLAFRGRAPPPRAPCTCHASDGIGQMSPVG